MVCENHGDNWEEKVRSELYRLSGDSIPDFAREEVDPDGVPKVYYPPQNGIFPGYRYNATIVANYAIDYYHHFLLQHDEKSRKQFYACIDWLSQNITYHDGYGIYVFNWRQPWYPLVGAPFTSGMTSGRAMEALAYAYKLDSLPKHLSIAKSLLNGFYQPIQSGGFTYSDSTGWWYEELADTSLQTPRILDGHLFAMSGVYQYWLVTKDTSAAFIFMQGLRSLKHNLPHFDARNGIPYYDGYRNVVDKKYHRTIVTQLRELSKITGDSLVRSYYEKWRQPLERPYLFRIASEGNRSGMILFLGLFCLAAGSIFLLGKLFYWFVSRRLQRFPKD